MKCLGYLIFFLYIFLPIMTYGSPARLLIIFSGEELGNLEPCGCFEGQIGGISRRHTFINSIMHTEEDIVFPVSLGDLIRDYRRQEEIKMEILYRAMEETGFILHNLGEKDIEIGPQLLSYLSQISNIPFLSSNIKITDSLPISVNQYILKKCFNGKHSYTIAFLGIISQSLFKNYIPEYVSIDNPVQTLRPLIKDLRERSDLIVLLSHATQEESLEIAKSFPEIGLIITGHGIDDPENSIEYVGNTAIVSAGKEGKYIGVVKYFLHSKALERKSIEIFPLDSRIKDSQKMTLLLKEYQHIVRDEDLLSKAPQASLPNELSYVGNAVCGLCHKTIYDHWSKTGHGASYNTLVSTGHQHDPECIRCHTTGYGYISGFLNYEKSRSLINVGCESCHGAGSNHIKNVSDTSYGLVDENACKECHDIQHSPKFQFNEFWKKIKHPEEVITNLREITE
ncbi:MAG: hypothetical protein E3K32_12570 [wastewater metagenome]|nr:hypothetical protein [Candidatus Loosdrechtia aerotolerans]